MYNGRSCSLHTTSPCTPPTFTKKRINSNTDPSHFINQHTASHDRTGLRESAPRKGQDSVRVRESVLSSPLDTKGYSRYGSLWFKPSQLTFLYTLTCVWKSHHPCHCAVRLWQAFQSHLRRMQINSQSSHLPLSRHQDLRFCSDHKFQTLAICDVEWQRATADHDNLDSSLKATKREISENGTERLDP